jgi:hypothetical protein
MHKPKDNLIERRRYIRLAAPVSVSYTAVSTNRVYSATTKNISAEGLRFETPEKDIDASGIIDLKLVIPGAANPVHAKGKVMWKKKVTLDDNAPYDVGLEISEIEEDNKNTFLKFLCDLIYGLSKGAIQ